MNRQAACQVARVTAAIVLAETPGIGDGALRASLEGGADVTGCAGAHAAAVRRRRRPAVAADAERRAHAFVQSGGRLVTLGEPEFPPELARISWGPPWLYVRGAAKLRPRPLATVVGTRKATPSALEFVHELCRAAAASGIAIASGLALGVDAAAHRGALAGGGPTLAIVATGLDICYPRAHRRLLAAIEANGLVMSEMPPGAGPLAYRFPRRNRILAAIADCVVVAQAPARSGALITARHALDAGVDILAIPGDPNEVSARGSNRLLADCARPLLGVEDLIAAISGTATAVAADDPTPLPSDLGPLERRIVQALDLTPAHVDTVARRLGAPAPTVLARAATLELRGLIESLPGSRLRLTPEAAGMDRW